MPNRILQHVLDRMRADLATNLDLKTIAAESGYRRTHFLRIFRASVGCSPHQWLTRLRIEESKICLQKKANSLIDIALDCGFSSHGHFTSTFRKIVGVTPREYRRNFGLNACRRVNLTKGGLESVTSALAIEFARDGVRFNSISPGVVDTPMHGVEAHEFLKQLSPLNRLAEIAEVVDLILFLESAPFINGEIIPGQQAT